MAAAIPFVGMGISAIGGLIKGRAASKAGQAAAEAEEYNAQIALEKMKQEEQTSEEKFSGIMGRQRALYGKAGVDIASGSPLMVMADTAMKEREEQQRIQKAGEMTAELAHKRAKAAAYSGKMEAMSSYLGTIGSTITGAWDLAKGL